MWRWPVGRRKQRDRENFSFLLAQFVKEGVLTVAGAEKGFILLLRDDAYGAEPPTTWTILEQDGPNHLGLWYNALRITNGPNHLGLCALLVADLTLDNPDAIKMLGQFLARAVQDQVIKTAVLDNDAIGPLHGAVPHNMDYPPKR